MVVPHEGSAEDANSDDDDRNVGNAAAMTGGRRGKSKKRHERKKTALGHFLVLSARDGQVGECALCRQVFATPFSQIRPENITCQHKKEFEAVEAANNDGKDVAAVVTTLLSPGSTKSSRLESRLVQKKANCCATRGPGTPSCGWANSGDSLWCLLFAERLQARLPTVVDAGSNWRALLHADDAVAVLLAVARAPAPSLPVNRLSNNKLYHVFGETLPHSESPLDSQRRSEFNSFNEYYDVSSVMSVAIPHRLNRQISETAYRGVTALHMLALGALDLQGKHLGYTLCNTKVPGRLVNTLLVRAVVLSTCHRRAGRQRDAGEWQHDWSRPILGDRAGECPCRGVHSGGRSFS